MPGCGRFLRGDVEQLDFANTDAGAALVFEAKAFAHLQVDPLEDVAGQALGQPVEDDLFLAEVEGAVDVVEQGVDGWTGLVARWGSDACGNRD